MGKLALYLVLGFSILYMIIGSNSSKMTTRTVENMADYHAKTSAHNIAVSATNLACNELFLNGAWDDGYSDVDFLNGDFDVSIQVLGSMEKHKKINDCC